MFRQRGAVLVVSLIFLLIITAIAVASMSGSSLQTIMASNSQQREAVFRAAESAVEQALGVNAIFDKAMRQEVYTVPDIASRLEDGTAGADISCLHSRVMAGYQISGNSNFSAFLFEVTGSAETGDERMQSEIVQGVAVGMRDNREPWATGCF